MDKCTFLEKHITNMCVLLAVCLAILSTVAADGRTTCAGIWDCDITVEYCDFTRYTDTCESCSSKLHCRPELVNPSLCYSICPYYYIDQYYGNSYMYVLHQSLL